MVRHASGIHCIEKLRNHMVRIVPESDSGPRQIAFVAQSTQARGAQKKCPGVNGGFDTNPPGREHLRKVSTRKQQNVIGYSAQPADHSVRACSHLVWAFSPGTAITEDLPVRACRADLGTAKSLVFAVVPFD